MRRPVGLDLNGWHDFGCRDWDIEDPDARLEMASSIEGGIGSVVVEHGAVTSGGPQAILSPIGRGGGWGEIGAIEKRRSLVDHWVAFLSGAPSSNFAVDLKASTDALSVQTDHLVFCIPDRPELNEAQQQGLLAALGGIRRARVTLLWRPVALLLGLLAEGNPQLAVDGRRVLCLIHSYDGLEAQRLIVRRLSEGSNEFAPERAGPGEVLCHDLGLSRLLHQAEDAVAAENPKLTQRSADVPRLPLDLLFQNQGAPAEEVIRRSNGTWLMIRAPRDYRLAFPKCDLRRLDGDADLIVLLSPLAIRHRLQLEDRLRESITDRELIIANPDTAARGALFAARRIERNIPHYLDHLDQISLVVSRKDGPAFEDLIPANETVAGNREYVSKPITNMLWTAGMSEAQFYIRKGQREIRRWVTPAVEAPRKAESLEIQLRQMPAQGWAKISITSSDWDELRRSPINIDWGTLPVDPRSEEEILATLGRRRPVVPLRVRYMPHIGLWDGSLRPPGLKAALRSFKIDDPASLQMLTDTIRTSYRLDGGLAGISMPQNVYPIGTDGDFPDEVDEATGRLFGEVIEQIRKRLLRTIRDLFGGLVNNNLLLCLTWIFARCPRDIQDELEAAFEAILSGNSHSLLGPRGSSTVIINGLGRVVTDKELLQRLIPKLSTSLERPYCLAALSSLLSRPEDAPDVLSNSDVQTISESTIRILQQQRRERNFGPNFKYALMAIAGLLRVRKNDPWALTADRSDLARRLVEELSAVLAQIRNPRQNVMGRTQKIQITESLITLLSSDEGTPEILTMMDTM